MTAYETHIPDSVVEVKSLSRRFGAKTALDNVSITLPRGIVFGLVGAEWSGQDDAHQARSRLA